MTTSNTIAGPGSLDITKKVTDATGYSRHPKDLKLIIKAISTAAGLYKWQHELNGVQSVNVTSHLTSVLIANDYPSMNALALFEDIAAKYDWTITKENAVAFGSECAQLVKSAHDIASGVLYIEDNTTTQEQDTQLKAERAAAAAKRETERAAAEKAAVAEADKARVTLATDLVSQLPEGIAYGEVDGIDGIDGQSVPLFNDDHPATTLWPYGALSNDGDNLKDVAVLIRARIKDAQKLGLVMPCKISVRVRHHSSIDVSITATVGSFENPEYDEVDNYHDLPVYLRPSRYLPEVESALEALKAIVKVYHWDQSDTMTDYFHSRFYSDVGMDWQCNNKPWQVSKWMLTTPAPIATEATVAPALDVDGFTIETHTHTKKGRDMALVIMSERTERAEYKRRLAKAQELGGWWSRAWVQTPAGFAFWCDDNGTQKAVELVAWITGDDSSPEATPAPALEATEAPALEITPAPARNEKLAVKAEASAVALTAKAESLRTDRLENTPKRVAQGARARMTATQLERGAAYASALAVAWRDPSQAVPFDKVPNREAFRVMGAKNNAMVANGYHSYYVEKSGNDWIDTSAPVEWLRLFAEGLKDAAQHEAEAQGARDAAKAEALATFRAASYDGFYPTPPAVVSQMIDAAGSLDGLSVLEPSAGLGDLVSAAREKNAASVQAVECVPALVEFLSEHVGIEAFNGDFLAYEPGRAPTHGITTVDCVLMNPPYEKDAALDHVRHAYKFLKAGGVLVALVPAGVEGYAAASSNKRREFASWLAAKSHDWQEVDPQAFSKAEAFRQTGIATALLVINKP